MHCRKISQEQTFKGHAGSLWIEPDYEGMQSWTFAAWSSSCISFSNPGDVVSAEGKGSGEKTVSAVFLWWPAHPAHCLPQCQFSEENAQWGMLSSRGARSTELCCRQCGSASSKQTSPGFAGLCYAIQLLQQGSCWCRVPREAAGNEEPPEHQQTHRTLTIGSHISYLF